MLYVVHLLPHDLCHGIFSQLEFIAFTYFLMYCVMASFQSCKSIVNSIICTLFTIE